MRNCNPFKLCIRVSQCASCSAGSALREVKISLDSRLTLVLAHPILRILESAIAKMPSEKLFCAHSEVVLLASAVRSGDRRPVTHEELLQLLKEKEASDEEKWDALARDLMGVLDSKVRAFKRSASAPNLL